MIQYDLPVINHSSRAIQHFLVSTVAVIISLAGIVLPLYSQVNPISFRRISLTEGLSQSIVECILQDKDGFMWFGTEDGLNIFDGYEFTVLRNVSGDATSLSYNDILCMQEDPDGILWIGTFNGGLNRYDPATGIFTSYRHDPEDAAGLCHDVVHTLLRDRQGNLWIGTNNGLNRLVDDSDTEKPLRFMRYEYRVDLPGSISHNQILSLCEDRSGGIWVGTGNGLNQIVISGQNEADITFRTFYHQAKDPYSLSDNVIRTIYQDKRETLWVGSDGGLNRLDDLPEQGEVPRFIRYQHDPHNGTGISHNQVFAILEDRDGVFWVGTNGGGLNQLNRDSGRFTTFLNDPLDPVSLGYNEIRCIYEDRSGNLWIGTYGGGISQLNRARKKFRTYAPEADNPNSLNQEIVWNIHEDSAGVLWIGTHGGGLNRFDREKNKWHHYRHNGNDPASLSHDQVRIILEDSEKHFWLGTNGGGINRFDPASEKFTVFVNDPDNPHSLAHNQIRALLLDRNENLWIGTRGGGLDFLSREEMEGNQPSFRHYRSDPALPNSISSNFIRTIHEDRDGILWIGTLGAGLNRFDPQTGRFDHYRHVPDHPDSLSNDYVFDIHESANGILWLATWGGGINRFDRQTQRFKCYDETDGLPRNTVYGILEDENGHLWLSTNQGLSRFDPVNESFKNYFAEDGLQSNEFNGGAFFKSRRGEMFFGGINGFNAFFPADINDNSYVPPVVITEFQKFNRPARLSRPLNLLETLNLSYQDYVFSFEFAALDYTMPAKNRYAYKMEGLDKDWVYTDARKRYATYTTLPPGSYTFRVKGSNNDGHWNETGTSLKLNIAPPLWQTNWFRFLLLLFLAGAGYLVYAARMKTVRMKTELEAAHAAQMAIMPQDDPEIPGFEVSGICLPANEVGGDFFDYFWFKQDMQHFGIAIGDVSGKAMNSAMTAVLTDGMIVLEADECDSVKEIMMRVNRTIYRKIARNMFTALCLVSLDIQSGQMTFSNAGLCEPLLKENGTVKPLKNSGARLPLGSVPDVHYQENALLLSPGSVVIFYSDGLPEALNTLKHFYGEERLHHLISKLDTGRLSAPEIRDAVIDDVRSFASGARQHDDLSLVVLKAV